MRVSTFVLSATVCSMVLSSCQRTQTTANFDDSSNDTTISTANSSMDEDLNKSKTIMYTLPAPVEIASIIKETGVKLDDQILNDLSKSSKYDTNIKMAINLGIYATDMSLSGMFNQSQRMVDYLSTFKDLTRNLGIIKVFDEDLIKKLENTDLSKDEALNIISEVYMNTNQYLVENNRKNIATIVMAGGWIEGVYLALNLVDVSKMSKEISERIVAQKLTLTTLFNIIDSQDPDGADQDLAYVRGKLSEIKGVYDYVTIDNVGRVSALTDPEAMTTTIKANSVGKIDEAILEALKNKVNEVRKEFVE